MGETNLTQFSTSYNNSCKVVTGPDSMTTPNSGSLATRETMERLGIMESMKHKLHDPRKPARINYPLADLVRLKTQMLAQGYTDDDDVTVLRQDPALRISKDSRRSLTPLEADNVLPSQSTISRSVEIMSGEQNQQALREAIVQVAVRRRDEFCSPLVYMDMDSVHIKAHGNQPGARRNGHQKDKTFHALVALCAERGDMLGGVVRPGNVHTAHGAEEFARNMVELIEREGGGRPIVRADAGFSSDRILRSLEKHGIRYLMRLPSNPVLKDMAGPYLKRMAEGESRCYDMEREAKSWDGPRRVVLVVVQNPHKLFPDSFWLVTNLDPKYYKPEDLLAAYRRRGKAEGHIGEFKDVLRPSLSSCDRPKTSYGGRALESLVEKKQIDGVHPHNETLFLFNLLAYQVVHAGRCLVEEGTRKGWSIRRFRERFLLAASRVVRRSRYVYFVISSSAAPYWNTLWRRFDRLRWVGG